MDETLLTAAICGSRNNYEAVTRIGLQASDFGEAARCVVNAAGEQYRRDADLQAIDLTVLRSQVQRKFGAGSMADSVMEFVAGFPSDVSGINCIEEYRLLRLSQCSTSLATLLATGQHGQETQDALAKYSRLASGEEGETFKPRLTAEDFEEDDSARIPLSPPSLNKFVGGGALRGHNITVYARPEAGKSLFGINWAAALCKWGYRVLYVANEEPSQDITRRLLSRLTGAPLHKLRERDVLVEALDRAGENYDNWFLLHKAGVTARDISTQCQTIRPDVVIVDQLKNLACANDNRALQLDMLAQQVRAIGSDHNCVTLSITQAGDSAQDKLVLSMNDIEWSNTGIPGAADLMIGIGLDPEFQAANKRMLSIAKNKLNGRHGAFHVWVDPERTAFLSKARSK